MKLAEKLIKIRESIGILQKTTKGQSGKYVDPELILAKAVKAMNDQGVMLTTNITESNSKKVDAPSKNNPEKKDYQTELKLEMIFLDAESEEKIIIPWYAIGTHMQDPAMSFGTALSYAERYFMLKTFSIATPELDPEYLEKELTEIIPEEDIIKLREIIESKGYPDVKAVLDKYGKKVSMCDIKKLSPLQYDEAVEFFKNMAAYEAKK